MNELLKQALFPTSGTGRTMPTGKGILADLRLVAAQMAELEPPKQLNDDVACAVLVSQQFLEKLINEMHINCFDKSCPNEHVVSVLYGLPVIVVPFIKTFKIITNKEYRQIYKVLIENLNPSS